MPETAWCGLLSLKWTELLTWSMISPQEVIQGAKTGSRLLVVLIITSIPANRVFSEALERLFVTKHAAVFRVTDVIRVGQPLHVILILTWKHQSGKDQIMFIHQQRGGYFNIAYSLWWEAPWSRWWRRPSTGLVQSLCSPRCWRSWSEPLVLMPAQWRWLGLTWSCAHSNTVLHQWKICQNITDW